MCGIVYLKSLDRIKASDRLTKRYHKQKERGTQGFGLIEIKEKISSIRKQHEAEILAELVKSQATEILFHHRQPTSTINLPETAHPIMVKHKQLKSVYYLVHNGIISNAVELKLKHEALGYKYQTIVKETTCYQSRQKYYTQPIETFNDSEALAIDLALVLSGEQAKMKAEGSIAFIVLETNKRGKPLFLHYGRNWKNPLLIEQTPQFFCLKSSGGGVAIDVDKLHSYDYATGKTEVTALTIGNDVYPPLPAYQPLDDEEKRPFGFQPLALPEPAEPTIVTLADLELESQLKEEQIEELRNEISYYQSFGKSGYEAEITALKEALRIALRERDDLDEQQLAATQDYQDGYVS